MEVHAWKIGCSRGISIAVETKFRAAGTERPPARRLFSRRMDAAL